MVPGTQYMLIKCLCSISVRTDKRQAERGQTDGDPQTYTSYTLPRVLGLGPSRGVHSQYSRTNMAGDTVSSGKLGEKVCLPGSCWI